MLQRGKKLTEVLKQPQYSPGSMEEQVLIIFVATHDYLVDVPVDRVKEYEKEFVQFVRANHDTILQEILQKKQISDDMRTRISSIAKEFTESFNK